jgi:cytochrome P450
MASEKVILAVPETKVSAVSPAVDDLRAAVGRFFSDPGARANPALLYARLVQEAPVLELGPLWLVSGFDEVMWLSGRHEMRSFPAVGGQILPMSGIPSLARWSALMLPMRDGADQRRLRGLATSAFSPRRISELNAVIEQCIDEILAQAMMRGEMDVVDDLAVPLPVAISAAMLDVAPSDRNQVKEWAMLARKQMFRYDQNTEEVALVEAQLQDFSLFVRSLCEVRRRHPGDDLISDLASAGDAGLLSPDELVAFVLLLFMNGLETLTAGLTMGVWEFLQHAEERVAVAADRAYAEAVFDEAVRLHSPSRFSARTLASDVELNGHRLREGNVVALCYAAANRDPRRFPNADRFDPKRPRTRHLGFGHGIHACLGAVLSLSAGACVLERLAKYGGRLTTDLTPATVAWSPALAFTTLESLPVRLAPSMPMAI